ncbi:MAG: SpoIIE family protein phosphatase [Candidatus Marinimicrobia bacterium]|jgi:serine phosphatase RsbU (regulator of sigma subunit)/ABC-type amino acid transport substrate-binding protein|nr:SpoIIE family protein phosphatase [Candidatus Neomarinimicrobiota bacterium]MBT3633546.1 SpoIIE family protein phosphatase [Candidatus Neomarinimicrobiota bacterium]MBT3681688.1 SpoIIE family protein phosphatase [Candidatus Neomarinimicrobiota bacterium]MBT3758344.1 SpoIIE family protein phosphatase [Candidatus Neomarinimicrobiota bacterium]MBT3895002.1 SpoIIE family protein phosphatase [Candidatus Neomarinimicrobiota bacterium]
MIFKPSRILILLLLSFIIPNDSLIVGIYDNEPLVFMDVDGVAKGIYIDILDNITDQENWVVEYKHGSWAEGLARLESKEIDILLGIAFTADRNKIYNFNDVDIITNWAQIYLSEKSDIMSMIDMTGKRIAVQEGDIYFQAMKALDDIIKINATYIEVADYAEILELVSSGKVDAGLVPRIFGQYNEKNYQVERSPINFSPVELRFAAPMGDNDDILTTIDQHLIRLKNNKNSGYYQSLNLWIEGVNKLVLPKWMSPLWTLLIIVFIIVIIAGFNIVLQWQVRVKTEALRTTIEAKEKIEGELRVASAIQMDLLPRIFPPFPDKLEFDIYAVIEPAKEVGGDLYDFFLIDSNHLCFLIGDVSDKGVPAALFMARTKTLIETIATQNSKSNEILNVVNQNLSVNNDSMMFVTLICAILTIDTGKVIYTVAGHNPPILIPKNKPPEYLSNTGDTALGIFEDIQYKSSELILNPGDTLFLYTDGVTEAFNDKHEEYSEKRLLIDINSNSGKNVKILTDNILRKVNDFSESVPQSDDIAIITLQYKPDKRYGS